MGVMDTIGVTGVIFSILFPALAGFFLLIKKETASFTRKKLLHLTAIFLIITALLVVAALFFGQRITLYAVHNIIIFRVDKISWFFAFTAMVVFLCAGFFSFEYMKHESHEKRYYGFYLIVFGVMNALCFAGNLLTFYLFFELLTLSSMPLVLHNGSKEAIMAGLKYLFYSLAGAYAALFGIYFIYKYSYTLTFTAGGTLSAAASEHTGLFLTVAFAMILGFGVKAGMFPMHAWLPAAHPVAPAPASAVLSAVIVKAGVLGILRVVYYIFGTRFLYGTWVQTAWLTLTLVTVFMGSMLAYREPVLKKRLAYSTVSQVSYILFGLALMNDTAVKGSLLHVLAHGFIKAALFLCAGAIIYTTGKTRTDELRGIGKEMPLTMWCYTIISLGLIGIPPAGGFASKWYLATGALSSALPVFRYLGPAILLVSALLTAGYLLPITINGFFPGADFDYTNLKKREPSGFMTVTIVILTVLSVLIGMFPDMFIDYVTNLF